MADTGRPARDRECLTACVVARVAEAQDAWRFARLRSVYLLTRDAKQAEEIGEWLL